jgi:hypothetical protein
MSTPARKRLMRDFKRLQQDPPAGISGAPHDNNIMLWNAVIFGCVCVCVSPSQTELVNTRSCSRVCEGAGSRDGSRLLVSINCGFLSLPVFVVLI